MAIANAPPIGRKLAIEFYLAPQRESTSPTDQPILIRKIDLPPDGKVETELPAAPPATLPGLRGGDERKPVLRSGGVLLTEEAGQGRPAALWG